jgi:hypothetical protein
MIQLHPVPPTGVEHWNSILLRVDFLPNMIMGFVGIFDFPVYDGLEN